MVMDPSDRDGLESQWQANEARLNWLQSASRLDRELSASEIARLEDEQDAIEWRFGLDHPSDACTKRWSGAP
jgi:hypothetical protein